MKTCTNCKKEKANSEFYKDKRGKYGLFAKCKTCHNIAVAKNSHKYRDYQVEYARNWREQNKELCLQRVNSWKEKNKLAVRSHDKVKYAKKANKLFPNPCIICGIKEVHAHHTDYSKPLFITWLCRSHHRLVHSGKIKLS
jgi:hypothetical protein